MVDFGDLSTDQLPEQLEPPLDCSTCQVFYPDNSTIDSNPTSPLINHSCSSNIWGFNCCGYDWSTSQCAVQQFFPEFGFLHKCGSCSSVTDEDVLVPETGDGLLPSSCSTCKSYYPGASMTQEANDRGKISPLTSHACSFPYDLDGNVDERWGESCCAYDWKTRQCGVLEFSTGFTYLNDGKSSFIYPCDECDGDNAKDSAPLLDCSTCDTFYSANSITTNANEVGDSFPLSTLPCDGSDCCGYDLETNQCRVAVVLPIGGSIVTHVCGGCEKNKKGIDSAILGSIIALVLILVISGVFLRKRHRNQHRNGDGQRQEISNGVKLPHTHNSLPLADSDKYNDNESEIVVAQAVYMDGHDDLDPSEPPYSLINVKPIPMPVPSQPSSVQPPVTRNIYKSVLQRQGREPSIQISSPKIYESTIEVSIPQPKPELSFMQKLDLRELWDQKSMGVVNEDEYEKRKSKILDGA